MNYKRLQIINSSEERKVPGKESEGKEVTMEYVNVHSDVSGKGNCNSRGSRGCITVCPNDSKEFFENFDFSGKGGTTGNASGTVIISRGNKTATIKKLKEKASKRQEEFNFENKTFLND